MGGVAAVVLAAGGGKRLRGAGAGQSTQGWAGGQGKAFVVVGGRPLLGYALAKFLRCPLVDELVVVIRPEDAQALERLLRALEPEPEAEAKKPVRVVAGGPHRQDSSWQGVRAAEGCRWVLVHDAARPFFSLELVERLLQTAKAHGAAVPAWPAHDALKRLDPEQACIVADLDREAVVQVQTPQAFAYDVLRRALERAQAAGRVFPDESGAVLAFGGVRPRVVPGEALNFKLTTPEHLALAEGVVAQGLLGEAL